MANTKSAKKAVRQARKRTIRNKALRDTMKGAIKALRKNAGSVDRKEFSKVQGIIDKVAKEKVIHKNKAARVKSRLLKSIKLKKVASKSAS